MAALVLAVVLGGFLGLIIKDCFKTYSQRQEQKYDKASTDRLIRELDRLRDRDTPEP